MDKALGNDQSARGRLVRARLVAALAGELAYVLNWQPAIVCGWSATDRFSKSLEGRYYLTSDMPDDGKD